MLNQNSHKTNKRIITLMMMFLAIGLLLLLGACTTSKINRSSKKTEQTKETLSAETAEKLSRNFDFSSIMQQDFELKYIPLDPSKEMGIGTNPITGGTVYQNAIPIFKSKTTNTQNNLSSETTEAKTTTTAETEKATTDETTKQKIKISVPWYAFLILAFFGFATMIGLYLITKLSNRLKKLTS